MTFVPSETAAAPRYSWAEVWTAVLTRPSVATFQEILNDPAASRRRALTWMLVTLLVSVIFITVLTRPDPRELMAALPAESDLSLAEMQSLLTTSLLCGVPLALLMGLALFRFTVWLVQMLAVQFGAERKTDSGTKVMYSFAAIQAPLNIISLLFTALPANPIVGVISLTATFYQFFLMTLALRAVYGITPGRAAGIIFLTIVTIFGAVLVLLTGLLSLM